MSKSDSSNPTELLGLALRFAQSAARSGYVLLATTTLCLTLTMVLARAWWTWEEQQENRFRTHVTTLLAQQTDRFKSSNHQLLLAALLESSIVQKFGCPNDALEHIDEEVRIGPLCEEIEGIFKDFDQVEKDFKAASLENPSQQTNKIAVKVEECRQTSKKCSDSSMVDADHPVYGNAGCVTNAALFIPPLPHVDDANTPLKIKTEQVSGVQIGFTSSLGYGAETLSRIAFAIILDRILGARLPPLHDAEHLHIVQIYYVSREGVFRIWSRLPSKRSEDLYCQLIHNDVVARHVNQFIARDEQLKSYQTSPPYLDVTNSGVVQTVCHPEGDPDDPRGVLCIDVAPTISAPERTDPLLDIALVRTDGDGKIINEQGDVQLPGRVVSELENLVRHPKADIGYFTVEGELFAVILVRGSLKSNVFAIARIKRRAGHAILTTSLLFMMVLSMGLVVTLVLVSLRRRSLESEEGMLRNLQVGVIQVSGDDLILEANDRAEELVGYTLPPLGGGEKAVSFSSLFHERTFKEDPRGRLRESSLREIREERLQGHSSRYFVKKREDGLGRPRCKWMHVYGSPWLLAGKSDARTFAVLSPASSHREGALEEAGNEAGVDA